MWKLTEPLEAVHKYYKWDKPVTQPAGMTKNSLPLLKTSLPSVFNKGSPAPTVLWSLLPFFHTPPQKTRAVMTTCVSRLMPGFQRQLEAFTSVLENVRWLLIRLVNTMRESFVKWITPSPSTRFNHGNICCLAVAWSASLLLKPPPLSREPAWRLATWVKGDINTSSRQGTKNRQHSTIFEYRCSDPGTTGRKEKGCRRPNGRWWDGGGVIFPATPHGVPGRRHLARAKHTTGPTSNKDAGTPFYPGQHGPPSTPLLPLP